MRAFSYIGGVPETSSILYMRARCLRREVSTEILRLIDDDEIIVLDASSQIRRHALHVERDTCKESTTAQNCAQAPEDALERLHANHPHLDDIPLNPWIHTCFQCYKGDCGNRAIGRAIRYILFIQKEDGS